MTAVSFLLCLLLVGGCTARSCRNSDETDVPGDIGAAPDFYVSSPQLLEPGSKSVQLSADSDAGATHGIPYLIAFADGSYVWGYTGEDDGKTRQVYRDSPFEVFWHGQAERQWLARHPSGRAP
jgi:hypothetical protein